MLKTFRRPKPGNFLRISWDIRRSGAHAVPMRHLLIVTASVTLLSACSGSTHLSNPVAPTSTAPAATASYTVHGVVFADTATGVLPLQGAQVQGPRGSALTTGIEGSYTLTVPAGTTFIYVTRPGYAPFQIHLDVTADMQFDVHMGRAATVSLSGVVFEIVAGGRVPIEGVEVYL